MSEIECEMPGTGGTLAKVATRRAVILSPKSTSAFGFGPTHVAPASITFCAKLATSERKP